MHQSHSRSRGLALHSQDLASFRKWRTRSRAQRHANEQTLTRIHAHTQPEQTGKHTSTVNTSGPFPQHRSALG